MNIILPAVHANYSNRNEISQKFRSLIIPYAGIVQATADFGTVIMQRHTAKDFALGYQFTCIEKPVTFQMEFDKPVLMLSYLLDGEIDYLNKGPADDTSVKSGRYHLCYENEAIHPIALGKGYLENFYISFSEGYLQNIDTLPEQAAFLLEAFKGKCKESQHTQFYKITGRMRKLISEIISYNGYHVNLFIQSRINELLLLYLLSVSRKDFSKVLGFNERPLVKEIAEYIARNLDKPLTLAVLVRKFGKSEVYLNDQFRRCFNQSLNKYVQETKMLRAKELLRADQYFTVEEIAYQCGYSDAANFSNAFKRRFGHNTSHYRTIGKTLRKNHKENKLPNSQ